MELIIATDHFAPTPFFALAVKVFRYYFDIHCNLSCFFNNQLLGVENALSERYKIFYNFSAFQH